MYLNHFSGAVHNIYSLVKTESTINKVYSIKLAALTVLALIPVFWKVDEPQ
jgi:hypothetical protein